MKTLILFLIIGVLAFGQEQFKAGEQTFKYEGATFTVYANDRSQTSLKERVIACSKSTNGKEEYYLFITDENYKVLRFFPYKESRWYDIESEGVNIN